MKDGNFEMRKMAFYRNKCKQFSGKHQENTFQMPMPAGQSLSWKVCMHRTHSGEQQICTAGATAWALVASLSSRPWCFPQERRSCYSAGVGRPSVTVLWGSCCIKDFLTDAATTSSTLSMQMTPATYVWWPPALSLGGWQGTAAQQPDK